MSTKELLSPVEVARADLLTAACKLHRGGKRGAGTHVSITVESWEAFTQARRVYAMALDATALAEQMRDGTLHVDETPAEPERILCPLCRVRLAPLGAGEQCDSCGRRGPAAATGAA